VENDFRFKELRKVSIITIILNLILTIVTIFAGIVSASPAVLSDGLHTFTDVFSTVLVMLGLKLSSEGADEDHPYGHQRIESIISLISGIILAITSLYIGYIGIKKLILFEQGSPSILALSVTILSILLKEWMFHYSYKNGKKYNSLSMIADAWHHRSDAIGSIAVLVGVAGVFFGYWFLEPLATVFVCLIILKVAFEIGKNATAQLIDTSVDNEKLDKINSIAMSVKGVDNVDLLQTRISNNIIFVDIEISVNPHITVSEGHDIAKEVHDKVESSGLSVAHCMVHVNPTEVQ
jgi:cation diffusion facilitator family transporter